MTYTLLLDTSSLMYRAFFALPESITTPDSKPINALHGYLDMTARLLRDYAPDELIHVYDADWRPAARADVYPPYKADRPEEPETLTPQFEWLPQLLDAIGMPQAKAPDWEADDAIGSLCAKGYSGDRIDIITGDRDLLQLVQDGDEDKPNVRLLFTVRGVSNLETFDAAAVEVKHGVPPDRYVDFATLRGDPSDGLPGVPGIGEKTAARLVNQYASLDDLVDHADELTPKLAANIREATDYLNAMERVVPIRRDVQVNLVRPDKDTDELSRLAEKLGLGGPVERLNAALQTE
jgi:5'-3' exonuclease